MSFEPTGTTRHGGRVRDLVKNEKEGRKRDGVNVLFKNRFSGVARSADVVRSRPPLSRLLTVTLELPKQHASSYFG